MAALWFISNIALSDHFPIGLVCNKTLANKTTNTSKLSYHTYINYNKVIDYDYPKFDEFINIDENLNLQDLGVNGKVNILTNVLTNYNLRMQTISKRAKRPKQICWFNEDIKKARKMRDQYKKSNNLTLYRYYKLIFGNASLFLRR